MQQVSEDNFKFALEDVARDTITGFTGVIAQCTQWINNCNTYAVIPKELDGGKVQDSSAFDQPQLEMVEQSATPRHVAFRFPLGAKVKDKITGFTGITVARNYNLNRVVNYGVQPSDLRDGKIQDREWFSENMLELVEEPKIIPSRSTGGPERKTNNPRY